MFRTSWVILLLTTLLVVSTELTAQEDTTPVNKVWTIDEVLAESSGARPKPPIEYCQGGRFAPCVCWQDVAREMRYRPALRECNGNAAVVLSGKYRGVFSVVVRDTENRDRWPPSNFGGCTPYERDELGLSKCSAFKVQERFPVGKGSKRAVVHCLGAPGYSKLFKRVVRVTAKLADSPNSNDDPLVRWCLKKGNQPLN